MLNRRAPARTTSSDPTATATRATLYPLPPPPVVGRVVLIRRSDAVEGGVVGEVVSVVPVVFGPVVGVVVGEVGGVVGMVVGVVVVTTVQPAPFSIHGPPTRP